jgi:hypothetical protein
MPPKKQGSPNRARPAVHWPAHPQVQIVEASLAIPCTCAAVLTQQTSREVSQHTGNETRYTNCMLLGAHALQ